MLAEDSGDYFRDRNAARYPEHPIEPAVIASLSAEPSLPSTVDIVACASTLGNLLRLVRGEDKVFRMSVELVHGTAFFIRRENSARELIPDVRGYGHTFPEAYTTWEADVIGSASHQRIIRYNFGRLGLLVRSDPDGYLGSGTFRSLPQSQLSATKAASGASTSVHQLSDMFLKSHVSSEAPTAAAKVKVAKGGCLVDQDLVFDMKTRGGWKKNHDILGGELPRLWVAQIPNFVLAFHEKGVFRDIRVQEVASDVEKWERLHTDDLAHLAALLQRIVALLSDRPDGRLELCHVGDGNLAVHEQLPDVPHALSPAVEDSWKEGRLACDRTAADDEDGVGSVKGGDYGWDAELWDSESEADFTACSADSCGYCGKCTY